MRYVKLIPVLVLVCLIGFTNAQAKRRPFVRGVFLVRNTECYGQDSTANNCCPGTHWNDERGFLYSGLINNLHANHITGWDWPERTWMDSVCNAGNGAVRKWALMNQHDYGALNWQYQWWRDLVIQDAQNAYNDFGQDIGLFGYFISHELDPADGHSITEYYPGLNYMCWVADSLDPDTNRYTSLISNTLNGNFGITPGFSDSVSHLDYLETDIYLCPATLPPSGIQFQNRVDVVLEDYNNLMNWFRDDSVSWVAAFQTSAWHEGWGDRPDFYGYCDLVSREYKRNTAYEFSVDFRFPSREEMRLAAFLALSRGAKGLRTFTYGTCFDQYSIFWGLLHFRKRVIFHPTDPGYQEDTLTNYYPFDLRYNYPTLSLPPFQHVAELYADIEPYGDSLTNLYITGAGSFRQNRDSTVTFIKGVRCADSASVVPPGYWWEASTFTDTATANDADYFMLVNRITCNTGRENWQPAGKRGVSVILTRPSRYQPVIREIFSGREWWFADSTADSTVAGEAWWTFTDSVGPGDGNLYKINDVYLYGPIQGDFTLDHDVILMEDLLIEGGATLRINQGVNLYIAEDVQIQVVGNLVASGTSSDSIRFIALGGNPQPGDWRDIYVDQNAACSLSYCSITNATTGVEARNYSDVFISHSNISHNLNTGVYAYKADLITNNSRIADNGVYGIYGLYSSAKVNASRFVDNDDYDIYLSGGAVSGDSTLLLYDTLINATIFFTRGIYLSGIDKARVNKCVVAKHRQTAITLSNSDAPIDSCSILCGLDANNAIGIYLDNYSTPQIRHCLIDSMFIGVRTLNAEPDMGTLNDPGYSSIRYNPQLPKSYYIYHVKSAPWWDTLYAVYNYYFTGLPSASRFYSEYAWIPIKYWPWLMRQPKLDITPELPLAFAAQQNYPNPFNSNTVISFALDQAGYTRIAIYNILGQRVVTLAAEDMEAGEHTIVWTGRNDSGEPVSSGIYFYVIESGDRFETKKMTLLR